MKFLLLLPLALLLVNEAPMAEELNLHLHFYGDTIESITCPGNPKCPKEKEGLTVTKNKFTGGRDVNAVVNGDDYGLTVNGDIEKAGNDYVFKAPSPTRCVTVKGLPCKFPFIHKGKTFEKCTTYDSENGQPWCPSEVDDYKKANPLKLDDCVVPGCPVEYYEDDDDDGAFLADGDDAGAFLADGDDDKPFKTCAEVRKEKEKEGKGAFIPECQSDGKEWKRKQCHRRKCWCVQTKTGHTIEGTEKEKSEGETICEEGRKVDKTIMWGQKEEEVCLRPGQEVKFVWKGIRDNLNKVSSFDYARCNATNKTREKGPRYFTSEYQGTFYFICGVNDHWDNLPGYWHCKNYRHKAKIRFSYNCDVGNNTEIPGCAHGYTIYPGDTWCCNSPIKRGRCCHAPEKHETNKCCRNDGDCDNPV